MSSANYGNSSRAKKNWISWSAWIILFFVLLLLRAWPRLVVPEVWNEDAVVLSGWINHGVASLLHPINGYLLVLPRLVSGLALQGSFVSYPALSTYLAWVVTIAICAFVALAPSRLQGAKWAAAATLLIPSDPEAFGLPLYLLWWSAVLMFALLFWARDGKFIAVRVLLLATASLSSPVCIATLPAYLTRGLLLRKFRGEIVLACSAFFFTLIQLYAMWPIASGGTLSADDFLLIPQKFLGSYLVGNLAPSLELAAGCFGTIAFSAFLFYQRKSWTNVGLAYLWSVCVLMSITRVDIHNIQQAFAGPRYFFLPYILQSWILVQAICLYRGKWPSWIAFLMLIIATANAIPHLWRSHSPLEWKKHAHSCPYFKSYDLPVHFDGNPNRHWHLRLNNKDCSNLIKDNTNSKSFPFRQIAINEQSVKYSVRKSALLDSTWHDAQPSEVMPLQFNKLVIMAPSKSPPSFLRIRVLRGQVILLRSDRLGSKPKIQINDSDDIFFSSLPMRDNWIALEFSNRKLPKEFTLRIIADSALNSTGPAIALLP